jgi:hypothetical protein
MENGWLGSSERTFIKYTTLLGALGVSRIVEMAAKLAMKST